MSTPNDIRRRRDAASSLQAKVAALRQVLQSDCPHPTPKKKYCGSKGHHFEESAGDYWIEWGCADCGKRWTTGTEREHINKYPGAIEVTRFNAVQHEGATE